MKKILYLTSLEHLDRPIIKYINSSIKPNWSLEIAHLPNYSDNFSADFRNFQMDLEITELINAGKEIRAIKFRELWNLAKNLRKIKNYSQLLSSYRIDLINYIENLDPDYIVSSSDHNLTLDLVSSTRFIHRSIIIQPALITKRRYSFRTLTKHMIYRTVNLLFKNRVFDVGINWGDRKYVSNYMFWSLLETKSRYGNSSICGDLFMEEYFPIASSGTFPISSILVILPNLLIEKRDVVSQYVKLLQEINHTYPAIEIFIRWHPLDNNPQKHLTEVNFIDLNHLEETKKFEFDIILSGVSALVVNLRRGSSRIVIFHPGIFGKLGKPYVTEEYFFISSNIGKVLDHLSLPSEKSIDTYRSLFQIDDKARKLLENFLVFKN